MFVDLSTLESYGKSVVRCRTKEFAKIFIDAMWEQYPDKMKPAWHRDETNFGLYVDDPNGICYKHRIVSSGDHINLCQSTSYRSAVREGYTIIEIEELIGKSFDFGEVQPSDLDIKSLFGDANAALAALF